MELLELEELAHRMDEKGESKVKATASEWTVLLAVHEKICGAIQSQLAAGPLAMIGARAAVVGWESLENLASRLMTKSTPPVAEIEDCDLPTTLISISARNIDLYRACTSILTLMTVMTAQNAAADPDNDIASLEIMSAADTFCRQFKDIAERIN